MKLQIKEKQFKISKSSLKLLFPDAVVHGTRYSETKNEVFVAPDGWTDNLKFPFVSRPKHCLACGSTSNLTKHHVFPKRMLRRFSRELRDFLTNYRPTGTLCDECHKDYEELVSEMTGVERNESGIWFWAEHFRLFLESRSTLQR